MARVTYIYPCGEEIVKTVAPDAYRTYGDRINGQRPIKIVIKGKVSDEYLFGFARQVLHPINRSLIYKGKEWLNNE